MSDKQILSAQFPSSEVEQIEEYREKHGYNKSEALKKLVRRGLESEMDEKESNTATFLERLGSTRTVLIGSLLMMISGLFLFVGYQLAIINYSTIAFGIILISFILLILAILTVWAAALAQIALARPLRQLVSRSRKVTT
jgi:Arc/MetJ-type ribon-helix-helix transcriptional regulator